jgi:methylglutaconyl-CoA hydratase
MSTTDNVLSITRQGPVLRLTLSRPQRRNALSRALVGALLDAITAVDPSTTRVIVLAGEGAAFCAGGDISEYAESAAAGRAEADAETLTALLAAMTACPLPIAGRVHGSAYGGGFGLVCACDLAIAAAGSTFSLSEARLGLIPAVISPYVFAALGPREAKARMLLATPFGTDDALRMGLIQAAVAAEELDAAVDRAVADLLKGAPGALAGVKQRLPAIFAGVDGEAVRAATAGLLAERLGSDEAKEGLRAFLEKRPPTWSASA